MAKAKNKIIGPSEKRIIEVVDAMSLDNFNHNLERILVTLRSKVSGLFESQTPQGLIEWANANVASSNPETRVIVKSLTSNIEFEREWLIHENYLPVRLIDKWLFEPEKKDIKEAIDSFYSLVRIVESGQIMSSSNPEQNGVIKDYVGKKRKRRRGVENNYAGLIKPCPKIFPIYGVACIRGSIQDAIDKLEDSYRAVTVAFSPHRYFDMTTGCFGDSTNGGLLNTESSDMFDIANDLESVDHLRKMTHIRKMFEEDYMTYYDQGKIYPVPQSHVYARAMFGSEQCIQGDIILEALKNNGVFDPDMSEYIETHTWGPVLLEDLKIYIDPEFRHIFDEILRYLAEHHPELEKKLKKLERDGIINNQ